MSFIYFSLPVRLPSEIQKLPPRPGGFLVFGNFLYKTPFLERISVPSSFVSLFIFYILSYLLSKTMGCFSRCLMSSASDQKLFCEVCSAISCSFDEFAGQKVVSPSYSSAILAPPQLILTIRNMDPACQPHYFFQDDLGIHILL